jgi:hypothetical protein
MRRIACLPLLLLFAHCGSPKKIGECNDDSECPAGEKCLISHACTKTPKPVQISVMKGGPGQGSVTSQPVGIDCGTACSFAVLPGSQVTLVATAAPNSTFTGWSGACTGSDSCRLTVDAPVQVSASFDEKPKAHHKVAAPPVMCVSQCQDLARACKTQCKIDHGFGRRGDCTNACLVHEHECRSRAKKC